MAREQTGATGRRKANGAAPKPAKASGAAKDELLSYYRTMLLIRRFEERAGQLYGMGLIGGFCHLYIGQEAIAVGVDAAKRDEWKLTEPLRQTVLLSALTSFQKGRFEQAADRFREASKLGLRDKRLGPMLTLSLVKAGQRLLYEKAVNGQ